MKFILDKQELQDIKREEFNKGVASQEKLLNDVLNGFRDVKLHLINKESGMSEVSKIPDDHVFARLIKRLDANNPNMRIV